jgi:hypothetical protein
VERCLACEADAVGNVERCLACEADAVGNVERAFPRPRGEVDQDSPAMYEKQSVNPNIKTLL